MLTSSPDKSPDKIFPASDPRHYTGKIKLMMMDTVTQLRKEARIVDDPQAEALFETTADVLQGLIKAYDHFEARPEKALR